MGDDERQEDRHQDENGGIAYVTIKDVNQSNGVIHVIDGVDYRSN